MSALLYYLPNVKAATPDGLKAAGLGYLLPCRLPGTETAQGPDHGAGVVFYALPSGQQADLETPKMDAARQKWFRCAGGRFYCGYWSDQPLPGPEDLVRERMYDSQIVSMEDGRQWLFPLARYIPRSMQLDEEGKPVYVPLGKFQRFTELGEQLAAKHAEGGYKDFPMPESFWADLVAEGFGLNYRVGKWEVLNVLQLVTDANCQLIGWAALDDESFQAALAAIEAAKNADSPADTPDGSVFESGEQGE